jgi:hypothetical protein
MISYQSIVDKIIAFYDNHLQVKKVGSDFKEQMGNFATADEKYPLVYVVPTGVTPYENVSIFTLELYCFDIIQMDRANITTILSDTQQILQDLYLEFTFSDDYDFDIDGQPTFIPLNNDLLDYAAGWQMNISVVIPSWTNCQIPKDIYTAYSQALEWDSIPPQNTITFFCNGVQWDVQTGIYSGDIINFVAMCNANAEGSDFTQYGTYFDNGDNRVRLEMPYNVYNTFCPNGEVTLQIEQI